MGLRSSALICQRITNAIAYIVSQYGFEVCNYLDDFAGAANWETAQEAFESLAEVLKCCGIEESVNKAEPPSCMMVFLGVMFDTENLTLSVTVERLSEIRDLIKCWLNKVSVTHNDIFWES